jgi:diadenosine tetraphosphate (Ap4A) HIT family hydrolase
MDQEKNNCLFCNIPKNKIITENEFAYAIRDKFPVSEQHSLIIPKRHVDEYFNLTTDELIGCDLLLRLVREEILTVDDSVKGFNIGMNCGAVAGQTIFHCHIHLIPRRQGDVENPRGGIRHIIQGKGNY